MNLFLNRLIKFLVLLLLLSAVLIAFLPSIISTDWGRKQLITWINHSIPGHISIRRLEINWGKGQLIEGFILSDPKGVSVINFEKFSTEATLFQLIRRSPRLGFTKVENLNATVFNDQTGRTNVEIALGISSNRQMPSFVPSTTILSNVNAESYLFSNEHPLSLTINGSTQQDNLKGFFNANLSLNGLNISNLEGLKQKVQNYFSVEGSKEARLQLHIENFPTELIDRLITLQNPKLGGVFQSLIGDHLNVNIDKKPSSEGLLFKLSLATPLLQGDMEGIVKDDAISLIKASRFNLEVTPDSINSFSYPHFEILNSSKIDLTLSELKIPLKFFTENDEDISCLFGFKGELNIPEMDVNLPATGKIKLLQLRSHLSSRLCEKTVHIDVKGQANHGKDLIDLNFTSTIDKPNCFLNLSSRIYKTFRSNLSISHFPLKLTPFFNQNPDLADKIGPLVDFKVNIKPEKNDKWLATCSIETPAMSLKEAQFLIGDEINLISKSQLNWKLPENCLAKLFNQDIFKIEKPCSLSFLLKHFSMPLNEPKLVSFDLESSALPIRFLKLLTHEIVQVDDLIFKIDGKNQEGVNSYLGAKISLFNQQGQPSPIVPDPLVFKQNSKWDTNQDGLIEMTLGSIDITNSVTNIHAEARLDSEKLLEMTQPLQIQYTLFPKALADLSVILNKNLPKLHNSTSIQLNIEPSEFDLKTFSLSNLYLQGILKIKKIVFDNDAIKDLPILEDLFISWVLDTPRNNIYTNIKGVTYTSRDPKPSQVSAHMQFWIQPGFYDIDHLESEIRMNLSGLPTSTLNIVFGLPDLSPVMGSILDLDLKLYFDPAHKKPGYLRLVLDSTHLHAEGQFKLNERMELTTPEKKPILRLTVTPDSYEAIKKLIKLEDQRRLASPFTATGTLSHINFPLKKEWVQSGSFDFTLKTSNVQWNDSSIPSWELESRLSTENLKDHLHFSASVRGNASLKMSGFLHNLFGQRNELRPLSEMGLKANVNGQQLTPAFLYSFSSLNLDQKDKIHALFGETFDINASVQLEKLNGTLQGSVKGAQGQIEMEGPIKNGILKLSKPLEASLKLTPLFIQTFLTPNVPILSSAVGAENLLTFTIDPSEFSCPVISFKLDEIQISKGNLKLGKINFKNKGELQSVLSIIGPMTGQFFTIWFTPIYFELNRGILFIKRFDMLVAKTYSLANWGSVNLITHQADFVLGLPAQTLQYAFNIQGLEDKYILQVPLHTSKGKVEVDKKKATARITSLIAQTHGGDKGKLLGGILDLILSEKGEIYPNPTTQPFPWQGEFNPPVQQKTPAKEIESSSQQKEKKFDEKKTRNKNKILEDGNLKDLQDGAIQLLDKWLK